MESEQGRDDADRLALAERARDLEKAELARGIESVAGLDFDGRAAAGHQCVQAAVALLDQLLVRRSRGSRDRGGNPAAGFSDLLIARAGAAHRMFVGAGAAEDEVSVAIDQAW